MKIGIDCHTLEVENWAGKEQLAVSLIRELCLADSQNDYFLYFRRPVELPFPLPGNFKRLTFNLPTPFWQLAVMIDMLFRRIDFLYVPCTYLLPAINFFVPQAVNICDMTTFLPGISETHKRSTRLREGLLLKMALRNSRLITVISRNTEDDLLRFFKVDKEKMAIVYPGAKGDFALMNDRRLLDLVAGKYRLPAKFILSVGTLEPRKNGIGLIKAYEEYMERSHDGEMFLVFVGKKGWFYDSLLRQADASPFKDRILFMGYVPDDELAVFYNLAFCSVYPSFYEGFGLPIVEAMACGCPVITSNVSSMPEIAGSSALLIDPKDTSQIADRLMLLSQDKDLRRRMVEEGLSQSQQFTYKKMAERWLEVVNQRFK